jgi:hypothetical protein
MIYDPLFWRRKPRIPDAVSAVVGEEIGLFYYSHTKLNALFLEQGAPDDIPDGGCIDKCTTWLRRAARDPSADPFALIGGVLRDFMDGGGSGNYHNLERAEKARARVRTVLQKFGMSYIEGGQILSAQTGPPIKSLREMLHSRDLQSVQKEFDRALEQIERDPESGLTAACSILESLLTIYIEDEGLTLPNEQSLAPLWKVVRTNLGLDPKSVQEQDIQKILSGMISVIDGIGSLRTHAGSAHGRGRKRYQIAPRHARLAINAAHTFCAFILETWDDRKEAGKN